MHYLYQIEHKHKRKRGKIMAAIIQHFDKDGIAKNKETKKLCLPVEIFRSNPETNIIRVSFTDDLGLDQPACTTFYRVDFKA
jgi:hypothetical protein